MAVDASERLRWVVETMAVRPGEHLLEVGCGQGVAVDLVCQRLTTGTITAVDRSQKMIDAATKRNLAHIEAGRAVLIAANFHEAELPRERYYRVFAVHVTSFWTKPERDLGRALALLAPNGRLQLFGHGPDAKSTEAFARDVPPVLEAHGFRLDELIVGEISSGPIACISVRPA